MEQLSFFDMAGEASPPPGAAAYAPLADRMRPRDLEDYIGQNIMEGTMSFSSICRRILPFPNRCSWPI